MKFLHEFEGVVVKGKQLGRTINYPTANLILNKNNQIKLGVYFVSINIENHKELYFGIASYRLVDNDYIFETFIFNFDENIYGLKIKIKILTFIRENIKVNSLFEVKKLIDKDKEKAEEIWKTILNS